MKGKRIAGALLSLCLLGGLSVPAAASGIPGDINGDGLVNSKDAIALFRAVAVGSETAADVNGDGLVNAVDAAHLFAYVCPKEETDEDETEANGYRPINPFRPCLDILPL